MAVRLPHANPPLLHQCRLKRPLPNQHKPPGASRNPANNARHTTDHRRNGIPNNATASSHRPPKTAADKIHRTKAAANAAATNGSAAIRTARTKADKLRTAIRITRTASATKVEIRKALPTMPMTAARSS